MIPYDELETKASYMVENHSSPLYLRSKRRGGPFLFTATLEGPISNVISIDAETKILSKVQGWSSGPSWFMLSGSEETDLKNLLAMMFKKYKNTLDDEFRTTCDEIETGGMWKAYQLGLANYKTFDDFLKKAAELTDWGSDGDKIGDLFVGKNWYPTFLNDLGVLTQRGRSHFLEEVKKGKKIFELGIEEYDQAYAWEGELWTDGMGPCITIGLTGTYLGKRYNAMLHSQNPMAKGDLLLKALQSPFGKKDLPKVHQLQNVKYFAVGGSKDSQDKADSILETFYRENLPVLGVNFMTDQSAKKLSKAVHVTKEGNVYFSQYDPKTEL